LLPRAYVDDDRKFQIQVEGKHMAKMVLIEGGEECLDELSPLGSGQPGLIRFFVGEQTFLRR